MPGSVYKDYWRFGFQTRLYDWLSPWGYLESIRTSVDHLEINSGDRILDAGCGTGLALNCMGPCLGKGDARGDGGSSNPKNATNRVVYCPPRGVRYTGVEILPEGLMAAKAKALSHSGSLKSSFIQADMSRPLPLASESFSKVLAHFSVYTLTKREQRMVAWRSFWETLQPAGTLVAANPSETYDPKKIIEGSLQQLNREGRPGAVLLGRLAYPFTEKLGLKHIQHQLAQKVWHAYSLEDFKNELEEAGFITAHSESVYCGAGWLVKAKKD